MMWRQMEPMRRLRSFLCVLLIVLGGFAAPLSVLSLWLDNEIASSDRYTAAMAPLAKNEHVQKVLADQISDVVVHRAGLPPLTANLIKGAVQQFQAGTAFQTVWDDTNRASQPTVLAVLTGKGGETVRSQGGQVTVDVGRIVGELRQTLVDEGVPGAEQIPPVSATYVLLDAPQLTQLQGFFAALLAIGNWMPVIAVLLLATGVALARRRRRALLWAGAAVCVGEAALAFALYEARRALLGELPASDSRTAAEAVWDALTTFMQIALWTGFGIGALVVLGTLYQGRRSRRRARAEAERPEPAPIGA